MGHFKVLRCASPDKYTANAETPLGLLQFVEDLTVSLYTTCCTTITRNPKLIWEEPRRHPSRRECARLLRTILAVQCMPTQLRSPNLKLTTSSKSKWTDVSNDMLAKWKSYQIFSHEPNTFLCRQSNMTNRGWTSPIFVHISCVRGSLLIWRRCDTLCTFGFMNDVVFIPWDQWAEVRYFGTDDRMSPSLASSNVITSV